MAGSAQLLLATGLVLDEANVPRGTCFAARWSTPEGERDSLWIVTPLHVVERTGAPKVRFRSHRGYMCQWRPSRWFTPDDSSFDLAVSPFEGYVLERASFTALPLIHDHQLRRPEVGSRVVMGSIFERLSESTAEGFSAGFGGILASARRPGIRWDESGERRWDWVYLVDCPGFSGMSGSPCVLVPEPSRSAGGAIPREELTGNSREHPATGSELLGMLVSVDRGESGLSIILPREAVTGFIGEQVHVLNWAEGTSLHSACRSDVDNGRPRPRD